MQIIDMGKIGYRFPALDPKYFHATGEFNAVKGSFDVLAHISTEKKILRNDWVVSVCATICKFKLGFLRLQIWCYHPSC